MSDYTPTVGELRQAYVEASGASMAQESYYAEQVAEFERGLARVKAEALRDARDNVRASSFWADGSDNYADRVRGYLSREAERIEKETGLLSGRRARWRALTPEMTGP